MSDSRRVWKPEGGRRKNVIAIKMLKAGKYTLEEISNLTGLTFDEVQELQKSV